MSVDKSTYYHHQREEMSLLIPKSYHKILEIGCGSGDFRNNMNSENEYWGIEPVLEPALLARKKLDKVFINTYEEVFNDLPDQYFDLVICNDVIEHMVDHDSFFESIQKKMTDDSYLVASIPNVRYIENLINIIFRKEWEYRESGVLDRTHLRFFTEKSLKRTILKHGYKIEKFYYINSVFTNPYTLGAIIKRVLVMILGRDTEFLQFGIKIKK